MSSYFASDGDGYGDIVWRQVQSGSDARRYVVTVGDKRIGEVWRMGRNDWKPIAYAPKEKLLGLRSVDGMRSRWAATDYILNVGFRQKEKDQ